MNWDAIGAIGEIAGAVGVIITLFFLAAQLRQNTKTMRASAQQALIDTFYEHVWELGRDAALGDLVGRGFSDFEALSEEEKSRFGNLVCRWEGNLLNGILLHEANLLDVSTLNEIGDRFVASVQTKGGKAWYSATLRHPMVERYIALRLSSSAEIPDLLREVPYWIKKRSHDA